MCSRELRDDDADIDLPIGVLDSSTHVGHDAPLVRSVVERRKWLVAFVVVMLSALSTSCSDTSSRARETTTSIIETSTPLTTPAPSAPTSLSVVPDSVAHVGGCGSKAVEAVKEFIARVQAGDETAYRLCERDNLQISADQLAVLRTGVWLVDAAKVTQDVNPPPAPGEIVVQVPNPDERVTDVNGRATVQRAPHASGVLVTASQDAKGSYYITKIVFYASA